MRIFDPKDQLGNSLLSSADTQKSSVKLEKTMVEGEVAITLTSADISDIENWELSNASLVIDGQTYSFLPESVRNGDGSLTLDFGTEFTKATLVLKRTVFDGMKPITIEVRIKRLMAKTMATAGKEGYDVAANVAEWKALGLEAKATGDERYASADASIFPNLIKVTSTTYDNCFISVSYVAYDKFSRSYGFVIKFDPTDIPEFTWESDLPSLVSAGERLIRVGIPAYPLKPMRWKGKLPNLKNGYRMFMGVSDLLSFESELPSLVSAVSMFNGCKGLTSWTVALPNSITNASSMFYGCSGLTSFQSNMPASLTTNATSMFSGCKLDLASVERISRTIAECVGDGSITLGVSSELEGDETFNGYIETMRKSVEESGKGWTVVVQYNGDEES